MSIMHQGWAGNSTQLPRARREMGEDRRAAMEALLAKKKLTGYERGALRALARDGTALDRDRAEEKLAGQQTQPGGVTQREGNQAVLDAIADAIHRALDAEDDRPHLRRR